MKITVHCLVKNEENFIWYAINSVIDYVDEIMVWDQGSDDNTVAIIKSIHNKKIIFKSVNEDVEQIRQKMIEETDSDWIFILDGDEIWYKDDIKYLISNIKSDSDLIVSPNYMLVGDVFHFQEEKSGRYEIAGKAGHYNVRAIRKNISGLHVEGVYPNEAYVNNDEIKIQDFSKEKILFLKGKYLHASFLPRSSKDIKKIKYEIGEDLPRDFYYPEVFFKSRPEIVPNPWKVMSNNYKFRAFIETPLKKIKRRFI